MFCSRTFDDLEAHKKICDGGNDPLLSSFIVVSSPSSTSNSEQSNTDAIDFDPFSPKKATRIEVKPLDIIIDPDGNFQVVP
jgi:hypothetical protein